ncbi:MAG: PIN domain-containing protein [Candidatus Cloacimonetes bacterium]|nr:PIN domain-containing protein [Candidatus Cloacimonadota bacterium]MDY0230357.1 PIN domain-containing protein [Candidatus Cloacimonadaceae bacterium]
MKVFLDTNVFYNNWFVGNPNFKLLFSYLNNEQEDLLLSDLVLQEVENIRNRKVGESLSEINRQIKKIQKLNPDKLIFNESELNIKNYNLSELLIKHVESIEKIGYEQISHIDLVYRLMMSKKPFSGQEKGYRDALIWLSFVDYLSSNNIEGKVVFVSNNKSDFYTVKNNKICFHPDLQNDLKKNNIKANIVPYLNLFDFVNTEIDRDEYLIDKIKLADELDDYLIEQTEKHLTNLDKNELSELLNTNLFKDKITQILGIESDTWDLVDDTEIINVSKLSESEVYLSCQYIVSGMDLIVSIDVIEYNQHKDEIDSMIGCYDVKIDKKNSIAILSFTFKAYVSGSLLFDMKNKLPRELHIENISI